MTGVRDGPAPSVVVVMGVSGAGKSTIGRRLAEALGWDFEEGDEYHSSANVQKLRQGIPLTDEDRTPWLQRLVEVIQQALASRRPLVLTSSALKQRYRETLTVDRQQVRFVYLRADYPLLKERLRQRGPHIMSPSLLKSQLATLEEPQPGAVPPAAVVVDAARPPEAIVAEVLRALALR